LGTGIWIHKVYYNYIEFSTKAKTEIIAMPSEENMVVTPWEVRGKVDYQKLIRKFGTQPLTDKLLKRLEGHVGELHTQLRRKLFFSHRDLDVTLDLYEKGIKFVLYTGRGPSGPVHVGHLVPWIFTKYLQDKFKTRLYFQMTDDEKFVVEQNLKLKETMKFAYDNSLDLIALGYKPEDTYIIFDIKDISYLYDTALEVAKRVTFSTAKAVFGFRDYTNIGWIFWPAIQAVPCFIHTKLTGEVVPSLIPAAIDQDPYWRIARDVAPKLGYHKPAQIHCRFVPGLGKGGKMSASEPETCIFTTDTPEMIKKKVWNAFTGGKPTVKKQKKYGGDPDKCTIFQYFLYLFEEEDKDLTKRSRDCREGEIACGDCKTILAERMTKFLLEHQRKREKAKNVIDDYSLRR
jgi:tryptophanyl-tRNA synthetase